MANYTVDTSKEATLVSNTQDNITFTELYRFVTVENKGTGDISVYFQPTSTPATITAGQDKSHLVVAGTSRTLAVPNPDADVTTGGAAPAGEPNAADPATAPTYLGVTVSIIGATGTTPTYSIEGAINDVPTGD